MRVGLRHSSGALRSRQLPGAARICNASDPGLVWCAYIAAHKYRPISE